MASRAHSLILDELDLSGAQIEQPRHDGASLLGDRFATRLVTCHFVCRSFRTSSCYRKVPYTGVVEINGTADEPDLLLAGAEKI